MSYFTCTYMDILDMLVWREFTRVETLSLTHTHDDTKRYQTTTNDFQTDILESKTEDIWELLGYVKLLRNGIN